MGKKRIVTEGGNDNGVKAPTVTAVSKKKIDSGSLYVQSTYNNTQVVLTDLKGNVLATASSGSVGFKGAKKGTPFAAAKIGEVLGGKAAAMGMKEVEVIIKGVGSGRESAVRGFISKGININSIKDVTPVPHNGPKPKKPRRV
ncbi:MAG TPA: 30S ribosomal protein S11 [Parcubacteria group bacterium]|jgi:small subunit ribosomal protein S11|nr:30S ribosomal protein S11 [Parcubacteria group bacterium]